MECETDFPGLQRLAQQMNREADKRQAQAELKAINSALDDMWNQVVGSDSKG